MKTKLLLLVAAVAVLATGCASRVVSVPVTHHIIWNLDQSRQQLLTVLTMSLDPTIAQLQDDIAEMQCIVLYYQNRILRKQIAIEEIIQSQASKMTSPIRIELGSVTRPAPVTAPPPRPPTVTELIKSVLPEFKGEPLDYKKLRKLVFERYPNHTSRMRSSFYGICEGLVKKGTPIQFPPKRHGPNRIQLLIGPEKNLPVKKNEPTTLQRNGDVQHSG